MLHFTSLMDSGHNQHSTTQITFPLMVYIVEYYPHPVSHIGIKYQPTTRSILLHPNQRYPLFFGVYPSQICTKSCTKQQRSRQNKTKKTKKDQNFRISNLPEKI